MSTTYFSKGILKDLGHFIKENEEIDIIYVNATLTSMQQKKLEKRWNDIICGREDRIRRYFLKSVSKTNEISPTELDSESELSATEHATLPT
jgi:hypothetical protein